MSSKKSLFLRFPYHSVSAIKKEILVGPDEVPLKVLKMLGVVSLNDFFNKVLVEGKVLKNLGRD